MKRTLWSLVAAVTLATPSLVLAQTQSAAVPAQTTAEESAVAEFVHAGDLALQPSQEPMYLVDAPGKPLETIMKNCGVDCSRMGISVYGFIEGSYTASFNPPPGNVLAGRVFEIDSNEEVLLNQIDLTVEKALDYSALAKEGKWDIGGKVEWIYGSDARFIHANGLNFYGGASPQLSPENQFDLVQAYADVAVPVGSGLLLRGGKFVTLLGYETINPTLVPLYSRSYMFGYAIPFTHTGVLGTYSLTDKASFTGGIVRGWEQSLQDNNDVPSYIGQIKYVVSEKLTGYLNVITGPEQNDNNSKYRTVVDVVATYAATTNLSLGFNSDYGWEPDAGTVGQDAQWYGVAFYGGYKLNEYMTANARTEWFSDPQSARGLGGNLYGITLGIAVKPFPNDKTGSNLLVRPEIRYDYSDNEIFNAGTKFDQWTFAVDAIFTF